MSEWKNHLMFLIKMMFWQRTQMYLWILAVCFQSNIKLLAQMLPRYFFMPWYDNTTIILKCWHNWKYCQLGLPGTGKLLLYLQPSTLCELHKNVHHIPWRWRENKKETNCFTKCWVGESITTNGRSVACQKLFISSFQGFFLDLSL